MTARRGEVWFAHLDPVRGSEQAGTRPVLIFQDDRFNRTGTTTVAIPLTTSLRRVNLPFCLLMAAGEGGLPADSVLLCNQLRVVDESRLSRRLGQVSEQVMADAEECVLVALGIS
jgi:mRNA interferase MazF